ncbi:hypothetical protein AWB91_09490 [Mycobacterium paraense]|uniref:DUF3987 domain-containing protein n=1 Tax=Mycobacterium paraense TaxID=767916 RepID=A0ABX3VRX5_9MYCO|nr:DUF3987 domain-containing protein [Mycobacterium paraense]ORW32717.1 hypothetical protein AWB91_09490 [Mycobacterium paraense]ORW44942.1 hypothetical protein AWB88_04560 [Mycobacterium paraense]
MTFDSIPLASEKVTVPPFPVDAFPAVIADMVNAVAESTQTDPSMAATTALTALAACVGGRADVQVRGGWREPLCLFTATIARPGERKSPVQNAIAAPLHEVETELTLAGELEQLEWAQQLDMAKRTVAKLNKDAVNAAAKAIRLGATHEDKQVAAAAAQAAKDAQKSVRAIGIPRIPRLLADDVTPTSTATLLAEHGGRITILSTEGGVFDMLAGPHARGGAGLSVFLKAHAGDRIMVDRQSRGRQVIPHPALSMGLMVQPRVIEAVATNRDFTGRGLLARFLYAMPESRVGRRSIGVPPDRQVEARYLGFMRTLAAGMAAWTDAPAVVVLSGDADTQVRDLEAATEPTLVDDDAPQGLIDWRGKYVGAVVRIAGLLHFAEHGEKGFRLPVQVETIRQAERIGEYFSACAANVFAAMDIDPVTSDAEYLLERIKVLDKVLLSARDLFSATNRSRFRNRAGMKPALNQLILLGYLSPVSPAEKRTGGGRPPSQLYRVHFAADAAIAANAVSGASDDGRRDSGDRSPAGWRAAITARDTRIRELRGRGRTYSEIAAEVGCSTPTVSRVLRKSQSPCTEN